MTTESESNGKTLVEQFLARVLSEQESAEETLLADWAESLALTRRFLLGDKVDIEAGVVNTLVLKRTPFQMLAVFRIARFSYEAEYFGKSIPGILEQFENDLAVGNPPWKPDWRRRRRAQLKLLK